MVQKVNNIENIFLYELKKELEKLSKQGKLNKTYFNSFYHTNKKPGNCHEIVMDAIKKIISPVIYFEDEKICCENRNWRPDFIFFDGMTISKIVDFESPNSSDDRVINKDFEQYKTFIQNCGLEIPYIVITTLPDPEKDGLIKWKLRREKEIQLYTDENKKKIKNNPKKFWNIFYKDWLENAPPNIVRNIWWFNLRPTAIEEIYPHVLEVDLNI